MICRPPGSVTSAVQRCCIMGTNVRIHPGRGRCDQGSKALQLTDCQLRCGRSSTLILLNVCGKTQVGFHLLEANQECAWDHVEKSGLSLPPFGHSALVRGGVSLRMLVTYPMTAGHQAVDVGQLDGETIPFQSMWLVWPVLWRPLARHRACALCFCQKASGTAGKPGNVGDKLLVVVTSTESLLWSCARILTATILDCPSPVLAGDPGIYDDVGHSVEILTSRWVSTLWGNACNIASARLIISKKKHVLVIAQYNWDAADARRCAR